MDRLLDYWQTQLQNLPLCLELSTDYPRPPSQRYQHAQEMKHFSGELCKQLHRVAGEIEIPLFTILLTSFQILLYRFSQQTDIIVGIPPGKSQKHLASLGCLPLRTNLVGNPHFFDTTDSSPGQPTRRLGPLYGLCPF